LRESSGENPAADHLERRGYVIRQRNYRTHASTPATLRNESHALIISARYQEKRALDGLVLFNGRIEAAYVSTVEASRGF
jgi:hypothetical protein